MMNFNQLNKVYDDLSYPNSEKKLSKKNNCNAVNLLRSDSSGGEVSQNRKISKKNYVYYTCEYNKRTKNQIAYRGLQY